MFIGLEVIEQRFNGIGDRLATEKNHLIDLMMPIKNFHFRVFSLGKWLAVHGLDTECEFVLEIAGEDDVSVQAVEDDTDALDGVAVLAADAYSHQGVLLLALRVLDGDWGFLAHQFVAFVNRFDDPDIFGHVVFPRSHYIQNVAYNELDVLFETFDCFVRLNPVKM
jgi:hypothetical protein